ncbi:MAG: PmoA family protein [Verrucomicrobiales bacterium]|nr:PmoA family protein [Verrucomicrobiales bacterium]
MRPLLSSGLLAALGLLSLPAAAADAGFATSEGPDRLTITQAGRPVAEFVFRDERILRPYFANVHAPGGLQVTRRHPPVAGVDPDDHDTMHPGLWLAFGDVNGADFWRNKGRIEHVRFVESPRAEGKRLRFATECRLLAPTGEVIGSVTNRFALTGLTEGWLIEWEATFQSDAGPLVFGDQEEMGFGARVATPITEKNGGRIRSSAGLETAKVTWGQPADWCDYSGRMGDRRAGLLLMADPVNFRPSWWHNRNYGLTVANPFGRAAMRQGDPSLVTVPRGAPFRLRFAALVYSVEAEVTIDGDAVFGNFAGTRKAGGPFREGPDGRN